MSSRLYVKQIEGAVKKLFEGLIDLSDLELKKQTDVTFLSRGLAAYSLHVLAGTDTELASQAIVDGYDDNGIDALFFDRNYNILWVVQSKWIQKGQGQPETGDMRKFKDGILDLIRDEKFDRFNDRVRARKNDIQEAIESPGLKIKIVVSYTGNDFSKHNRSILDDLIQELNDYDDIASYEIFNLEVAYKALSDSINSNNIVVRFKLSNWGRIDEPIVAFYGQICAAEVAKWWKEYKNNLFSKNIRNFIGSGEVNDEIARTIREEPEVFWYFNNGITVLCQEIEKPGFSKDRKTGDFICKGISVINGAQTIGSIASVYEESPEKVEDAEILIKLISLERCPDDFGVRVTRATNTQNRVETRDFVSLDPIQEELRRELQVWKVNYQYKRSGEIVTDTQTCTLQEATVALACANSAIDLSILAKKDIDKLWSNVSREPYKTIFNGDLKAIKLWRSVLIYRAFLSDIEARKNAATDKRELALYEHGDLFILHVIFQQIRNDVLLVEDFKFDNYEQKTLPALIEQSVKSTLKTLEADYPTSPPARLFKSLKKCKELKEKISG